MITKDETVKATCWGGVGPDCTRCDFNYVPAVLQYGGKQITHKWLEENVTEDKGVVGNFMPHCHTSQRITCENNDGVRTYYLQSYLNRKTPKVIG